MPRKLTKAKARELSEKIDDKTLLLMLQKAKEKVANWDAPSRSNIGISRAKNWNLFSSDFFITGKSKPPIIKYRMLEEFGEYLPDDIKQPKKQKTKIEPYTEKPKFK